MRKGSKKRIKVRRRWLINPKTKIKKSNKIYSRQKAKREAIVEEE